MEGQDRSWCGHGQVCCLKTVGLSSQICEKFGPNLDTCPEGTILGLRLDGSGGLHLHINGVDQGVAVPDVPQPCHALVDLYGQCEQVSGSGDEEESWETGKLLVHEGSGDLSVADCSPPQVTIVSPDPGAASGKIAGTQGDMEKADMVDGALAQGMGALPLLIRSFVVVPCLPARLLHLVLPLLFQASRKVCAGVHRLLLAL